MSSGSTVVIFLVLSFYPFFNRNPSKSHISHNYKSESLNLANKQLCNRLSYMQSWHIQRISMTCRLLTSMWRLWFCTLWVPGITGPGPLVLHGYPLWYQSTMVHSSRCCPGVPVTSQKPLEFGTPNLTEICHRHTKQQGQIVQSNCRRKVAWRANTKFRQAKAKLSLEMKEEEPHGSLANCRCFASSKKLVPMIFLLNLWGPTLEESCQDCHYRLFLVSIIP